MARKRVSENPLVVSPAAAAPAPARRKPSTVRKPRRAAETSGAPVYTAAPVESVVETAEPAPAVAAPSREDIARIAYSLWEARGYQGGSPEEDWLRAEQLLAAPSAE